MPATAKQVPLAGVSHHYAKVNGTELHYVAAGTEGTPVLLVHGFPETWWTFRKLIPLLDGWRGAIGLYRSMLQEGEEIATIVAGHKLNIPVLTIGAGGGELTFATMSQVSSDPVRSVTLEGVGHYAALEAPDQVAHALLDFFGTVDAA
jgi:pimeloyl-ACP methyl ester carboxylesterase